MSDFSVSSNSFCCKKVSFWKSMGGERWDHAWSTPSRYSSHTHQCKKSLVVLTTLLLGCRQAEEEVVMRGLLWYCIKGSCGSGHPNRYFSCIWW